MIKSKSLNLLAITAIIFLSCAYTMFALSQPSIPDPISMMLNPPKVDRLVARRTFEDGTQAFVLMHYDGKNFVVKMSQAQAALDRKALVVGDDIAGRLNNRIWVYFSGAGNNVRATDLSFPLSTNKTVISFEEITTKLVDGVSRLGRSITTFGVEIPFNAELVARDGTFYFRDGDFDVNGTVTLTSGSGGGTVFVSKYERLKNRGAGIGQKEIIEVRGELSDRTKLPIWFELFQLNGTTTNEFLGRTDILETKLGYAPFLDESFTLLKNVNGGYIAEQFRTNDMVMIKNADQILAERPVFLFGILIKPITVRIFVLILMALTTASGAIIILKSIRGKTTK